MAYEYISKHSRERYNILQYNNKELAEQYNVQNIYNRFDLLGIIYGWVNFIRLSTYQTSDGYIYDRQAKQDLYFASPSALAKAIKFDKTSDSDVMVLSIINAFNLFANITLWHTFSKELNLAYTIIT